ncbi:MAG: hypothetical protein LBI13_04610 [Streptococcaceae bacterium]|jgi:hypothetical protein|nr:hypothetical protein [Streptococcaceae bacterium]
MRSINKLVIALVVFAGFGSLTACSSTTSPTTSSSPDTSVTSSTDTSVQASSSSEVSRSDLSQKAVYNVLQQAGYTGLSTFSGTYDGLDEAVQSQSMNYVLIGKVEDPEAVLKNFPSFNGTNYLQKGQWVFYTNYKVGTLNSLSDLKNIQ